MILFETTDGQTLSKSVLLTLERVIDVVYNVTDVVSMSQLIPFVVTTFSNYLFTYSDYRIPCVNLQNAQHTKKL
jgi:hypothetical protein